MEQGQEMTKEEGYGELSQSRVAVWSAVGIIFFIDLLNIVLSIISSVMLDAADIIPIVIDLYLGINLLRGKRSARKWMLIRAVLGLLVWGIMAIFQQDYTSLIMQAGFCGAIIILLTGISTRNRIVGGIACFLVLVVGGVVWAVIPPSAAPVESYTDVSIDGFTVDIPADWEEGDLSEMGVDEMISESGGTFVATFYEDKSGSAGLVLMVLNMKRSYELQGESWDGWQQVEEGEGMSKQDISVMFSSDMLAEESAVFREDTRMFTLGNSDACELLYTVEVEGIPSKVNYVFLFSEEHLGIAYMFYEEADWPTFEECWPIIRDSTRLR